ELQMPEVRMTVVPGNKIPGLVAARQSFARYIHEPAEGGSSGEDEGVVAGSQRADRNGLADVDTAKEAEAWRLCYAIEDTRHLLQLRMIRRDPKADQAVWHRQTFEHVDVNGLLRPQQGFRGIEAARPSSDDRDAIASSRTPG